MKKFIVILALALLSVGSAFSQAEYTGPALYYANEAQLFKTFTNYITTSDDSTGFISFNIDPVLRSRILLAREVRVIAVATDTVYVALNWIGRNGTLSTVGSTATGDSLYYDGTGSVFKVFDIRTSDTDLLAGSTMMKAHVVFANGATHQGTTTGRTLKLYLLIVR